jgi:hypothetical protein
VSGTVHISDREPVDTEHAERTPVIDGLASRERPHRDVAAAVAAGWSAACDGLAAVSWFRFNARKGRGPHRTLDVRAGDRRVQIGISPRGRVVRVFVDGTEVPPT